jgi:Tfp pilus assembly PilM family ATPase
VARFLAVDWDQNQLHLVAGTITGRTCKVQKAVVWQEEQTPNPGNAAEMGRLLKQRLRESGIAPAPLLVCIGRDRLIFKEVRLPPVPPEEEAALVRFQVLKELSDAPDDVIVDYASTSTNDGPERRALAMVLRKELLATYRELSQAAGIQLVGVAPRGLGIASCLASVLGTSVVTPPPEPADAAVAAVVIGERWTEFQVTRNGQLLLARCLNAGGNLAAEVRRNINVYNGQNAGMSVQAVYLAGKGIGELRAGLSEQIEIPVHPFDPFAGLEDLDLSPANRGSCAGAVGLLRGWASGELKVNFAQVRQIQKPRAPISRALVAAAALGVLLMIGGIAGAAHLLVAEYAAHEDLTEQLKQVNQDLDRARADTKRYKALEEWDSLPWLDELYDINAKISDVNTLHVTNITAQPAQRMVKSRYVAEVTIKGTLLDKRDPRKALDELVTGLRAISYYSVEAPHVEKNQFVLKVQVARRPPTEYRAKITKQEAPVVTRQTVKEAEPGEGDPFFNGDEPDDGAKPGVRPGLPGMDKGGPPAGGQPGFGRGTKGGNKGGKGSRGGRGMGGN